MTEPPSTRWSQLAGGAAGSGYAARLARLAATGVDMHGEATFCAQLAAPPARILDAGCGTGRVALRLAELGYRCAGVDLDASMLAEARRARPPAGTPDVQWLQADLATDPLPGGFDLTVVAGNVVPLLAPGTLATALTQLAGTLRPGGLLVTGFGLDAGHLPAGCPPTPLAEFDGAAERAGLTLGARYATWQGTAFTGPAGGYAVTVLGRPA
ncbi:MAG TPA: class I SAM-dependent methyltransferase [Jatrophihabitans sp.]|nr:class I SAM-dependent methyltransferase [Jatrophihabitans sp.]